MTQLAVAIGLTIVFWFVGTGILGYSKTALVRVPPALAPVLGASVLVLVAEFTRLLPGRAWPLLLALGIAILCAAACWLRRLRSGDLLDLVKSTLPGFAAALFVSAFFVFPWIVDGSLAGVLHFTSNHDAYHFSSGAQWLLNHSSLDTPSITATPGVDSDAPQYLPAMQTLTIPLRDGLELLLATTIAATKLSVYAAWPGLAAAMGGLIAAAVTGIAESAKGGRILSTLVGASAATSSMAVFQIANQNGASMLGIALAMSILLLWWQVVGDPDRTWRWAPLVVIGVVCAAFISSYWEGLPGIWIAIGVSTLVYIRPVGLWLLIRRLATVGISTLVVGFIGITIAFRSVALVGTVNDPRFRSPFMDGPLTSGLSWIVGSAPYIGPDGVVTPDSSALGFTFLALVICAIGIALCCFVPRLWPIAVGTVACLVFGWWWWGSVSSNGYAHRRFIEFAAVGLVAFVLVGWAAFPAIHAKLRRVEPITVPPSAAPASIESVVSVAQVAEPTNAEQNRNTAPPSLQTRNTWSPAVFSVSLLVVLGALMVSLIGASHALDYRDARGYGRNYDEVAQFVAAHPGNLLVATADPLDQVWLGLAVSDRPNTQFLVPCSCLVGLTMEPYIDEGIRPEWILTQKKSGKVTGDASLVGTSGRLALYKVGSGAVVVEAPNLQGQTKRLAIPAEK